jgi:hypothetical protein
MARRSLESFSTEVWFSTKKMWESSFAIDSLRFRGDHATVTTTQMGPSQSAGIRRVREPDGPIQWQREC